MHVQRERLVSDWNSSSSVSAVTDWAAGDSRDSFRSRGRRLAYSSSREHPMGFGILPLAYCWRQIGQHVQLTPTDSTRGKNQWSYSSTLPSAKGCGAELRTEIILMFAV